MDVGFHFNFGLGWGRGLVFGSSFVIGGEGGGGGSLEFLGDKFYLSFFVVVFFTFFLNLFLFLFFFNICSSFIHSHNFWCIGGKCKCWTVCVFCFWATTAE